MWSKIFKKKDDTAVNGAKAVTAISSDAYQTSAPAKPVENNQVVHIAKPIVNKKGEINELIGLFNRATSFKDNQLLRDALAKTVRVMTMGFNVSPLFTYVVNAAVKPDMTIKKMAYLYLVTTAKQNEELSILAINTFLKDCTNDDPKVRGLAIRSLTSLRVPSVVEYMMKPIGECLQDRSPYVRRCAVMGLLKAYYMDADVVIESGVLHNLGALLNDPDAQVTVDSIRVILELEVEFEVSANVVHPLLNRLGEFNEWCLCSVLELLSKYKPESDDELFNIMNLLEPALRQHNTAVVLATVNCYLKFTKDLPEITQQIYYRMKQPMLTLMANPSFEVSYCILTHLRLMLQKDPKPFQDEYRQFYVRYNEPSSIQQMKIQILPLLATDYNFSDICSELVEYVLGSTEAVSREAIRSISQIAIIIPESSDIVQETLMEFLDVDISHIRSETMSVFQDLLRKFPNMCHDIVPIVPFMLKKTEDSKGRSACLWILGSFPTLSDEAPYAVESIINEYEFIESNDIKLSLLTCTLRLFFVRAPECRAMLGELFSQALKDKKNPDLYDRALFYYKMLKFDVDTAKSLLINEDVAINNFDNKDLALENKLFEEFNSLSVIYHKEKTHFLADKELFVPQLTYEETDSENEENQESEIVMENEPETVPELMNLQSSLQLIAPQPLDPPSFQAKWMSLKTVKQIQTRVSSVDISAIAGTMENSQIALMASGDKGRALQFFFYAEDNQNNLYLLLFIVQKEDGLADINIRSTTNDEEKLGRFEELIQQSLKNL